MWVTIEIPEALAQRARTVALRRGVNIGDLAVSGLRAELDRRASGSTAFNFPVVSGEGLVSDLHAGDALSRAYGMHA